MRNITIQIPQPCHQNWADMQPNEQGRFCASCQKTVVDYTSLSDKELLKRLGQDSETGCGRFRDEQLNRPLLPTKPGSASVWQQWLGLLTMTLFGWQTARAQLSPGTNPARPALAKQSSLRPEFSATAIPARSTLNPTHNWTVTGRVMRMDSTGKQWPVPEAVVAVNQFTEVWYTKTDPTGAFELLVSTQQPIDELTARVSAPNRLHGQIPFRVSSLVTSIALADIVLNEPGPKRTVTGGGLAIIRTPSRWQKLKRSLFR